MFVHWVLTFTSTVVTLCTTCINIAPSVFHMIFRINTYKSCQQHLLVGLSDGDTVFSVLVTEFLIMCTFMQASRDKFEFQLVL